MNARAPSAISNFPNTRRLQENQERALSMFHLWAAYSLLARLAGWCHSIPASVLAGGTNHWRESRQRVWERESILAYNERMTHWMLSSQDRIDYQHDRWRRYYSPGNHGKWLDDTYTTNEYYFLRGINFLSLLFLLLSTWKRGVSILFSEGRSNLWSISNLAQIKRKAHEWLIFHKQATF